MDQTFLALTSAGVTFAIARAGSSSQFGEFVLIQAVLVMSIFGFRAIPGTWILVAQGSTRVPSQERDGLVAAVTVGVLAGAVICGVMGVVGFAAGSLNLQLLLSIACGIPGVLVVEAFRLNAYASGAPIRAAITSAAAFTSLAFAVMVGEAIDLVWWAPATAYSAILTVIALALALALRIRPSLRAASTFVAAGRKTLAGLTANFAVSATVQLVVPYAVAAGGGLSATAAVRGAQSLIGLALQVPQGLQNLVLVHVAQRTKETGQLPAWLLTRWTVLQVAVIGVSVPLLVYMPDWLGEALLGETWLLVRPIISLIGVSALATQILLGIELAVKALHYSGQIALIRAVALMPFLIGVVLGARWDGAHGAALALVLGNGCVLVAALVVYVRQAKRLGFARFVRRGRAGH